MAHEGRDLDRRTVLRNVALGSTVLAAGVGTAAGDGRPDSVTARRLAAEARLADLPTVRRVVEREAGPVVRELADLGYVESAADHDVAVASVLRKPDYRSSDADAVATVDAGRVGDDRGPVVTVRQRVDSREVEYHLLPDHDADGVAVVTEANGDQSVLVEPGAGAREVETQACSDCPSGCGCDSKCDRTELCNCIVGGHEWHRRLHEDCQRMEDNSCLCFWCEGGCDCQGDQTEACPE